jgi:DNA-binding beta-propeller fold protein YncE
MFTISVPDRTFPVILLALLAACGDGSDGSHKKIPGLVVGKIGDVWGIAFSDVDEITAVTHDNNLIHRIQSPGLPQQSLISYQGKVVTPTAVAISSDGNLVIPCEFPHVTDLLNGADIGGPSLDTNGPAYALIQAPSGACPSGGDGDPWYLVDSVLGDIVALRYNGMGDPGDNVATVVLAGMVNRIPDAPTHLIYLNGMIYVADTGGDRLLEVDPSTGAPRLVAGSSSGLDLPAGLAISAASHILVGNHGDGEIPEISTAGVLIRTIDSKLGKERLRDVAVHPLTGDIYVAHTRGISRIED